MFKVQKNADLVAAAFEQIKSVPLWHTVTLEGTAAVFVWLH
jgi:hypothetical protein